MFLYMYLSMCLNRETMIHIKHQIISYSSTQVMYLHPLLYKGCRPAKWSRLSILPLRDHLAGL
jgi:hypothetical protein